MATIQSSIELYDSFTPVLNNIMNAMNLTISTVHDMQGAVGGNINMDSISNAEAAIHQAEAAMISFNNTMASTESPQVAPVQPPQQEVEIPVHWQVDNMEVFTNTGIERFEQEAQSANAMMQTLSQRQAQIATAAAGMDILPPQASADMMTMQTRIQNIQQRIMDITSNPVNMGTDRANAELEQLRAQLSTALDAQNDLNDAMERMDPSDANSAYLRLSNTISGTERNIRDNVTEQGLFNQSIQTGTHHASELMRTINGAVAAYISFRSIGEVLNISDELVQTESRLAMMNDGLQTTAELEHMIYASAQDARGSFNDMASVVARFGNNARDAFGSNKEVVDFANLIQKQMTIAGASTAEASNAMLQLSQALGSGVLRGDELNSIFEQAPNLIQNIADYMEVPIGSIREMASEGELTADIVKASIFNAADDINAKFEQMPMTLGQVWTSMKNTALMEFQPVLKQFNDIANSAGFQEMVNGAIGALANLASIAGDVINLMIEGAGFIQDNWSWISPIIYGVIAALIVYNATMGIAWLTTLKDIALKGLHAAAIGAQAVATFAATVAQQGLNAALAACPITWIIIAVIALIAIFYAAVEAINEFAGTSYSATGIICGIFMVAAAFIGNLIIALINTAMDVFAVLWNFIAAFANFFANVFNDPVGAIARLFFDLVDCVLGLLETLASAIDTIFGSNLAAAVSGWRDSLGSWVDSTFGKGEEIMAKVNAEAYHFDRIEYSEAWDAGYSFGEGIENNLSNLFGGTDMPSDDYANIGNYNNMSSGVGDIADNTAGTAGNTGAIADNTADMADALDITNEELKYLRDIAERDIIDRTVYRDINIDMKGMQNIVKNEEDLDGIASRLASKLTKQLQVSAEGV